MVIGILGHNKPKYRLLHRFKNANVCGEFIGDTGASVFVNPTSKLKINVLPNPNAAPVQ